MEKDRMSYARNCIQKDPAAEPDNMHPNKCHATEKFAISRLGDRWLSAVLWLRLRV